MYKLLIIFLSLSLGFNTITNAQVDDAKAKEILDKVAQKAKTYENLKFKFEYRMQDKEHKIDNTIPGVIVMKGDMYNLQIMGRNVITNGITIWTHDPDAEEIQISNVDKSNNSFAFLKIITSVGDKYKSKYIKSIKEDGKSYEIIDLTPIKGESYYKIRVKIDNSLSSITEAVIYEKDNITYTFEVVKFEINLKLPAGYFEMKPANFPDSEVVDLR